MTTIYFQKGEKAALKAIMDSPGWTTFAKMYEKQLADWNAEEVSGADAFQELRSLHKKQGRVEGLKEFIDRVEKQAFE